MTNFFIFILLLSYYIKIDQITINLGNGETEVISFLPFYELMDGGFGLFVAICISVYFIFETIKTLPKAKIGYKAMMKDLTKRYN